MTKDLTRLNQRLTCIREQVQKLMQQEANLVAALAQQPAALPVQTRPGWPFRPVVPTAAEISLH